MEAVSEAPLARELQDGCHGDGADHLAGEGEYPSSDCGRQAGAAGDPHLALREDRVDDAEHFREHEDEEDDVDQKRRLPERSHAVGAEYGR